MEQMWIFFYKAHLKNILFHQHFSAVRLNLFCMSVHAIDSWIHHLTQNRYVYPSGCYQEHPFCEVFIESNGELPPDIKDEIHVNINCFCSLKNTEWNETVLLKRKNQQFTHHLPRKLSKSYIDSLANGWKPNQITFRCEIKAVDDVHQKNDSNDAIPTITPQKPNAAQESNQKIHSCQSLVTNPPFDHSDLNKLNKDSFIWMIPQNEIVKFRRTKQGYQLDSPGIPPTVSFFINFRWHPKYVELQCANGSKWILSVYPNGTTDKPNSVALFVRCCQYPLNVEMLTVLIDAYLVQTDTHCSNAFAFGYKFRLYVHRQLLICYWIIIVCAVIHLVQTILIAVQLEYGILTQWIRIKSNMQRNWRLNYHSLCWILIFVQMIIIKTQIWNKLDLFVKFRDTDHFADCIISNGRYR